jgi:hypothetical protein
MATSAKPNPAHGTFDAWIAGAEATLQAAFEVHNAGLAAARGLLDAASANQRAAFQEWTDAAQRAQTAALDAFHAQLRVTQQVTAAPTQS